VDAAHFPQRLARREYAARLELGAADDLQRSRNPIEVGSGAHDARGNHLNLLRERGDPQRHLGARHAARGEIDCACSGGESGRVDAHDVAPGSYPSRHKRAGDVGALGRDESAVAKELNNGVGDAAAALVERPARKATAGFFCDRRRADGQYARDEEDSNDKRDHG
jgi:hypothetical protein